MSHPRNLLSKKTNAINKIIKKKISNQKTNQFETICEKHKIGELTFRECKFVNQSGIITEIDHDSVVGNLRSTVLIIKANVLIESTEIHDVYQIEQAKLERDRIKKEAELQKAADEVERQRKVLESNQIGPNPEHEALIAELTSAPINESNKNNIEEKFIPTEKSGVEKSNKKLGNKFFRNFFKDLKSKFVLQPQSQYRFCEVKAETTDMIIDNAIVYKIIMPESCVFNYFLVVGDLEFKSRFVRRVDPAYKSELLAKEQAEFYDRIQKTEESKKAEPIKTIKPINPIDPVDPVDPVDPIDPIDPISPVDEETDMPNLI